MIKHIIALTCLIPLSLAKGCDPTNLRIAVFNLEMNDNNGSCIFANGCRLSNLSCRYMSHVNSSIKATTYSDLDSLVDGVIRGDVCGALYFSDNFTDALVARIALGSDADEETLMQSEIRVWVNKNNPLIHSALVRNVKAAYREFSKQLLQDCDNFTSTGNDYEADKNCVNENPSLTGPHKSEALANFSLCWPLTRTD
ncbi:uncharacterized protein LOC109432202 [Aedes albopictus]|uniref:Uncharacterized protein n=1 Tax=Aedes albopictus TaxID=7160 RepID=A0ABM1ZLR3_AEDAL|nr:uncharacterized protein LOC109432202 [Aedes albopictus]